MKWLFRALLTLLAVPVLFLVAGALGGLVEGQRAQVDGAGAPVTIALIQGPLHTDVLLPINADLRDRFAFATAAGVPLDDPRSQWLLVGWGSRAFYTTAGSYADITASAAFTAITGDSAVIRLDVLPDLTGWAEVQELPLSPAQYGRLLAQIDGAFSRDAFGEVIWIAGAGLTTTDAFFEARGHFNIFRSCNVWLGQVLRASGLRFGAWTPTTTAVNLSLWRFSP